LGVRSRLFRPPYGFLTAMTVLAAAVRGLTLCLWSVDVSKYQGRSEDQGMRRDVVTPGDILLLHDDSAKEVAHLPSLIRELKEQRLETVTVSRLLRNRRY
jgi:peptidoglycan/xylan/chitin deacetylase (PgdA/CDA1 family)